MLDLLALFNEMERPPGSASVSSDRFRAEPIPGYDQHRLGKDTQGKPGLLISVVGTQGEAPSPQIELEHLTVQPNVYTQISRGMSKAEKQQFTLIRCTSDDPMLHSYFLRIGGTLIESFGPRPTKNDIMRAVNRLAELFSAMKRPSRKSIRGLWAELVLIARAPDALILTNAWHVSPNDRYDFNMGSQRLEVKSAAGRIRQHHFALEQLHPPEGTSLLIASLFVESAGAGTALGELVEEVRQRVSDRTDLVLRVDHVIVSMLGEAWRRGLDERFDREVAEESIAIFEPAVIPAVGVDLPSGVSEVHFKADLTGRPTADLVHYSAQGGLFQAALPV